MAQNGHLEVALDITSAVGILVIAIAIIAVLRGVDVRLVMLLAASALGGLAGDFPSIIHKFFSTLASEQYVVPICSAMGFAYVLRESGCDRHLVLLLIRPVRRIRILLIPAAVLVGFIVNIAVISQASTAVAVGTVLIPLMRSAGLSPPVIGSALLLGASVGGELLNPGAPELRSVAKQFGCDTRVIQPILAPILAVQLLVATACFWLLSRREPCQEAEPINDEEPLRLFRAIVPLLPLAFLLTAGPPFQLFHVPDRWLSPDDNAVSAATRLIGVSMLLGCILSVVAVPSSLKTVTKSFFEGAGYAMTSIVSIIATANCFGHGVKLLNLTGGIESLTANYPGSVWPMAGAASFAFAWVCGSGMATTESLYRFFVQSGWAIPANLAVGAVVSIAAAAGRTASPAAAVVLLCGSLVGVRSAELLRRVSVPLIVATIASVAYAAWFGPR